MFEPGAITQSKQPIKFQRLYPSIYVAVSRGIDVLPAEFYSQAGGVFEMQMKIRGCKFIFAGISDTYGSRG